MVKNTPEKTDKTEQGLLRDERGATALEWTLLVAAIGIPSYVLIRIGLALLAAHYQLVTTINALPFP